MQTKETKLKMVEQIETEIIQVRAHLSNLVYMKELILSDIQKTADS